MFVPAEQAELNRLKQGDIVADVPLLAALNPGAIHILNTATGEGAGWQVPNKLEFGLAAVLSHSCEIAVENGVKLTSIVLSPLRSAASASSPEKLELLKSTNFIEGAEASFLKYFYLPGAAPLPDAPGGYVVDFSKCFSLRKNYLETLIKKKICEMDAATRDQFSLKLAVFFSRQGAKIAA